MSTYIESSSTIVDVNPCSANNSNRIVTLECSYLQIKTLKRLPSLAYHRYSPVFSRHPFPMSNSVELDSASINQEIAQQTSLLNELRHKHADTSAVEDVKKRLGELKKSLALLKINKEGGKDASKEAGKKRERLLLKTAKVRAPSFVFVHFQHHVTGHTRLRSCRDVLPSPHRAHRPRLFHDLRR
jgi:hypothetical protein